MASNMPSLCVRGSWFSLGVASTSHERLSNRQEGGASFEFAVVGFEGKTVCRMVGSRNDRGAPGCVSGD